LREHLLDRLGNVFCATVAVRTSSVIEETLRSW
jgi:hypothetical protein